jgi:LysM repeat protein
MYYKNQSDDQGTKKTEDKIQTPPAVNKDAEAETSTEPTTPPPTTTPTTPPVTTPTSGYTEYTVVSGDTLSGIANAHDMTSAALAQYNGITAETVLQIGQKLKIPNN